MGDPLSVDRAVHWLDESSGRTLCGMTGLPWVHVVNVAEALAEARICRTCYGARARKGEEGNAESS